MHDTPHWFTACPCCISIVAGWYWWFLVLVLLVSPRCRHSLRFPAILVQCTPATFLKTSAHIRLKLMSIYGFRNSWYEFWTLWYEYLYFWCRLCAPLAPVNVRVGKSNTDNSVKTVVFGNTEISHPFNHTVPEQSRNLYIKIDVCKYVYCMLPFHFNTVQPITMK